MTEAKRNLYIRTVLFWKDDDGYDEKAWLKKGRLGIDRLCDGRWKWKVEGGGRLKRRKMRSVDPSAPCFKILLKKGPTKKHTHLTDIAIMTDNAKICGACSNYLPDSSFSKKQWKIRTWRRRCVDCTESETELCDTEPELVASTSTPAAWEGEGADSSSSSGCISPIRSRPMHEKLRHRSRSKKTTPQEKSNADVKVKHGTGSSFGAPASANTEKKDDNRAAGGFYASAEKKDESKPAVSGVSFGTKFPVDRSRAFCIGSGGTTVSRAVFPFRSSPTAAAVPESGAVFTFGSVPVPTYSPVPVNAQGAAARGGFAFEFSPVPSASTPASAIRGSKFAFGAAPVPVTPCAPTRGPYFIFGDGSAHAPAPNYFGAPARKVKNQFFKLASNDGRERSKSTVLSIQDLPGEVLSHSISYLLNNSGSPGFRGLHETLSCLFKGLGQVSKSCNLSCLDYIQKVPNTYCFHWEKQLGSLEWGCRNRMKLHSFTLSGCGKWLPRSIGILVLTTCNIKDLQVLDLERTHAGITDPHDFKPKALARGLPNSVFERDASEVEFHQVLADCFGKKSSCLKVLKIAMEKELFQQSSLSLLTNVSHTLVELNLAITSSSYDETLEVFDNDLQSISKAIEVLPHLKKLSLEFYFDARFAIKSNSLEELAFACHEYYNPGYDLAIEKCVCPKLRQLSIESRLSAFGLHLSNLPTVVQCYHLLERLEISIHNDETELKQTIQKLSRQIKRMPKLKQLDLGFFSFSGLTMTVASESLEEIDVTHCEDCFQVDECVCPNLKVFKCTQTTTDSQPNGVRPVVPFDDDELVNFSENGLLDRPTQIRCGDQSFVGMEVPDSCIVEVTACNF